MWSTNLEQLWNDPLPLPQLCWLHSALIKKKLFLTSTITFQTFGLPGAVVPSAPNLLQNASLKSVWVPVGFLKFNEQSKLPEKGKFFCHSGALISKSQMELHCDCIIYVKLVFLPGNSMPPPPPQSTLEKKCPVIEQSRRIWAGSIYFTINLLPLFSPFVNAAVIKITCDGWSWEGWAFILKLVGWGFKSQAWPSLCLLERHLTPRCLDLNKTWK